MRDAPLAIKDEDVELPVAGSWRGTFEEIVKAFVRGDYRLEQGVESVEAIMPSTAEQIRDFVADYGETLIDLPADTWNTSVSLWMGTHWHVLVDLWTQDEGPSDLVLFASVLESEQGFTFRVESVHVP